MQTAPVELNEPQLLRLLGCCKQEKARWGNATGCLFISEKWDELESILRAGLDRIYENEGGE